MLKIDEQPRELDRLSRGLIFCISEAAYTQNKHPDTYNKKLKDLF